MRRSKSYGHAHTEDYNRAPDAARYPYRSQAPKENKCRFAMYDSFSSINDTREAGSRHSSGGSHLPNTGSTPIRTRKGLQVPSKMDQGEHTLQLRLFPEFHAE